MFFSVARTRLFLSSLLLLPSVTAREESLFTSSVTYCAPPETLFIQQFDVAYFAANESILFNITAASVQPNVTVSANIQLNVYGMHPFNFTIDMCSILGGALCPLPMYNFSGVDSIPLPSSLGVSSRIPGVAYKIPDLEAFAQLTLVEVSTGLTKACVQSTLSNGWSTHQRAVEWSTGGLALLSLLSAFVQSSFSPEAVASFRLVELLYLFQTIVTSALLNVNYPSIYRAYTLNFAWAMGLFSFASVQQSIDNMRHLTGGNMADASGGAAVQFVNRKMSPYNAATVSAVSSGIQSPALAAKQLYAAALSNLATTNLIPSSLVHSSNLAAVATVTPSSDNVLEAGVPVYTSTIGIATADAFMTVFFSTLILVAATLGVLVLGYLGVFAVARTGNERAVTLKYRYPTFARAWSLRISLILFAPVMILGLYQWSLKDSWLSIVLSVILVLSVLGYITYPTVTTLRLAYRDAPYALYSNTEHLAAHGPLYAQYRAPRYFFTVPLIVAGIARAILIAAAKGNGEVQVILLIVVEFAVLVGYLILRPSKTRGGDVFSTYLAITRLICAGLLVGFLETLSLAAIPRVAIGVVMAVVFSVAIIVMFVNILLHAPGADKIFRRHNKSMQDSAADSILEKGEDSPSMTESQTHLGRPRNPTPKHNIPLDVNVNQPYPEFTPTATTAEPYSPSSIETGSTNYGSQLPSRWSAQHGHSHMSDTHVSNPPQSSNSHRSHFSALAPSPHSPNFSSNASTRRESVPTSPYASHGHSRQPTIEEYPSSAQHAL